MDLHRSIPLSKGQLYCALGGKRNPEIPLYPFLGWPYYREKKCPVNVRGIAHSAIIWDTNGCQDSETGHWL